MGFYNAGFDLIIIPGNGITLEKMRVYRSASLKAMGYEYQKLNGEPEITANKNPIAVKIFDRIFEFMFKKYFASVRVKNRENYFLRNSDYANLFYGFHGCWWDGPLAVLICRKLYDSNLYMMIKDLYRFPVLSKIGGFSIEKDSLAGRLKAFNYAVNLLEKPENSVWIFPQGKLFPLDYRPVRFESGIAHICTRLRGVNLIPVAYKYTFWQYEKPDIFVEIGKPIVIENDIADKKEFIEKLQANFETLLDNQKDEILNVRLKEYKCILHNYFNWLRVIEKNFKPLVRGRY